MQKRKFPFLFNFNVLILSAFNIAKQIIEKKTFRRPTIIFVSAGFE